MKMTANRLIFLTFLSIFLASFAPATLAKTVTDPNHEGFTGKHPRMKQVQWKSVEVKCDKCQIMADQYNATVSQLLTSRYWVKFWREVHKSREKGKKDPFWPGKGDISELEGKAVAANLELMDLQNAQLELHRKLVRQLEQQASYLRSAIAQCEVTACGEKKPTKTKDIKVGGETIKGGYKPDVPAILRLYQIDWTGPYSTRCLPCRDFAAQLNALPGWVVRAHQEKVVAEQMVRYAEMMEKSNKVKLDYLKYTHPDKPDLKAAKARLEKAEQALKTYQSYFKQLLKQLGECEKKFCKAPEDTSNIGLDDPSQIAIGMPVLNCPQPAADQPITVGANADVGSSANFKEKAGKKIKGAAMGAVAGLLGLGSSGGGEPQGPTTYKDPIKKKNKTEVKSKNPKREIRTGGAFTADGLLISTDIKDAPGKGTFQTVYLENPRGWRLMPVALYLYEIWREWKLSVSWTRDTYVDGQHVSHEEGGWSESWRELIAKGEEMIFREVYDGPLWEHLGFNTAVSGARSLGTLFPVSPQMLANEPMNLVIHITDPDKDPVTTVPYLFSVTLGEKGRIVVEPVEQTNAQIDNVCDELLARDVAPSEPEPEPSLVSTGYPLPPGVTLGPPVSTGNTTGTIALVDVINDSDVSIVFPESSFLIPGSSGYQGYVVPGGSGTTVGPGQTVSVPLDGFCTDVGKPPVTTGQPLPDPSGWTVPTDPDGPFPSPGDPGFGEQPDEVRIISGAEEIIRVTEELQRSGELTTPFSSNPDRERETVNQQTIWRYTSELAGVPYTREQFTERLEEQYEEQTGVPISEAPEEDAERLQSGANDFWDAFELVGEKAKVLEREEEVPLIPDESIPVTSTPEEQAPMCQINKSMEHSTAESVFKMSESYKDANKRKNLGEWFDELPQVADTVEGGTFQANRYPASAWAVAGRDFIGGFSNGVAKHVFLEAEGGTDWVWSTEKLEVTAKSRGTHTITITPPAGQECETLVVGAEGGVVEAWSNAIDPIAEDRDLITALQWIRDGAIIVASVALAPATAGGSLAVGFGTMVATKAFDSEFSTNANAGAAAEGQMQLWVGGSQLMLATDSRSEVTGDGDVNSDGQKTTVGQISDTHATTLSANTSGLAALKSKAEDNGIAEATLESQVGVAMVGFCRCGGGVQVEYLNDSGVFLVEKSAAGAAAVATRELGEMLNRVIDPYMELPPEEVIPKAREKMPKELEGMLRDWYLKNGTGEGRTGYFGATQ